MVKPTIFADLFLFFCKIIFFIFKFQAKDFSTRKNPEQRG